MSCPEGVSQWEREVSTALAVLAPAQARVLAAWSCGMMVTPSCGLMTVAVFLARLLGRGYGASMACACHCRAHQGYAKVRATFRVSSCCPTHYVTYLLGAPALAPLPVGRQR